MLPDSSSRDTNTCITHIHTQHHMIRARIDWRTAPTPNLNNNLRETGTPSHQLTVVEQPIRLKDPTQSPNGNRIPKFTTAVYKVNRQDKTRQVHHSQPGQPAAQPIPTRRFSVAGSCHTRGRPVPADPTGVAGCPSPHVVPIDLAHASVACQVGSHASLRTHACMNGA